MQLGRHLLVVSAGLVSSASAAKLDYCGGQDANATGHATADFGTSLGSSEDVTVVLNHAINPPDQGTSKDPQRNWADSLWTHTSPQPTLDPFSKCVIAVLNTTREDDVQGANDPGDCSSLFPFASSENRTGQLHVAMADASRNALSKLRIDSPARLSQIHSDYCHAIQDDLQTWLGGASSGLGDRGLVLAVAAAWTSASDIDNQTCFPPSSSAKWARFDLPQIPNAVYVRDTFNKAARRVLPLMSVMTNATNNQAIKAGSGSLNCITTHSFSTETIEPPPLSANSVHSDSPPQSPSGTSPGPGATTTTTLDPSAQASQQRAVRISGGAIAGVAIAVAVTVASIIFGIFAYSRRAKKQPAAEEPAAAAAANKKPGREDGDSLAEIDSAICVEMPTERPRQELDPEPLPRAEMHVPPRDMGVYELPGSPAEAFTMDKKWQLPSPS